MVASTKDAAAFNTHSPGGGGSGLAQQVFRSPARIPASEAGRQGLCAAPASEKRYSLYDQDAPLDHECAGFIRTAAPPPDWLQKAWTGAKRRGIDVLTPSDINAEITAQRRKKRPAAPKVT